MTMTDTPRRFSTRNFSAPARVPVGGRTRDGTLTARNRRISRLENALEDARENSRYSAYCTPRRLRGGKSKIGNATVEQLQSVYDRIELHNIFAAHETQFSPSQQQAAEQAVQVFVDKMRRVADTVDAKGKFDLVRALTNDMSELPNKVDSKSLKPFLTTRQQPHEVDTSNQLNDITHWYVVDKEIGRGTFGRVCLATHRLSGTPVAIKSYARLHGARSCLAVDATGKQIVGNSGGDALEWRRARQEVNVLSRLRAHPNIVRFVEVFETYTQIHAVTQLVHGTSLCDILRRAPGQRLTETRAKHIFRQLTAAIEALHAQSVIHRDLKLENVLLDECSGHITVIDFGFSDFETTNDSADNNPPKKLPKKKNFCGTPSYMAPEVVSTERYDGRPVDIWSLGVLLYVMLCGKFPFQGTSFHQLYQKLRTGAQQLVLPTTLSIEARSLLQSILTVNPAKRPSASVLCCCSWLKDRESLPSLPTQLQKSMRLCFEMWSGTKLHVVICTALTELYGIQLTFSDFDRVKAGHRHHIRLRAFIDLATIDSFRHFLDIVAEFQNLPSFDEQQLDELDTTNSNEPQKSEPDIDLSSTRHKLQLVKLIGLVKTSLATN